MRMAANGETWAKTKVENLAEHITVGFVGSMSSLFVEEGVPLLRGQNIHPYSLDLTNLKYISQETHRKWKKSALKPGDVVIVRVGYPGTACVIPEGVGDLNAASLVIVRPNPALLDSKFLSYVINSPWGKSQVAGRLVGAAQQVFNTQTAAELEIPAPSLSVQRRIAGILSAYDELIENSQRRIKILESMARALYREWFVHFRYPGHESVPLVPSPLGDIPQGWEVKSVADSFEISGGGTPSRKEDGYWDGGAIQWFSPSDLTGASTMFMDDSSDHITALGLAQSSARLFPAMCVMLTSRATIGAIAINTREACTNQGFITCLPNKRVPLYFLFHWVYNNVPTFQRMASGATFKEISRGVFKSIDFVHPPEQLTEKFESVVAPVAGQVLALQRQVQNLRRTRDLLLPRLLSGQIDVEAMPA